MSTRSRRTRPTLVEVSPPRTRKGVSPPRSPARPRKASPPARSSSRSRKSPARKSPSRKPTSNSKFPARKSPSRTTKEETETAAQKSPAKRPALKSDITVKLHDVTKLDIFKSTRSRTSDYSIKDVQAELPLGKINGVDSSFDSNDVSFGLRNRKPVEEVAPRRSSRRRDVDIIPDIRHSLRNSASRSTHTHSDEEENPQEELFKNKSGSATRKLATPLRDSVSKLAQVSSRWEFGGRIGSAFLVILMPLTVFSILASCTKMCSTKALLNLSSYKSLAAWFNMEAVTAVTAQCVIQAVLSLVHIFGTKADRMDETGTETYFNAFFSCILTANVLFLLDFFNIFDGDTLLNNYLQLATISYIIAVILSIVLYLKSNKLDDSELNPYGNTGYKSYDFCMGQEIHPYIKNFDVKLWVSRISNINTLILAMMILKHGVTVPAKATENLSLENYKELLSKVQLKPTILIFSMMQILYIASFVMNEYKITTTFFWQSEGVGYLQIVASSLYPFYFTTISKYIADSNLTLSTNTLISASVLFVLGFGIMLISNYIKHEFRTNPLHPNSANLISMPTFHGKKLLVSRTWGVLRHPNYAGDILIHVALALPGILSQLYVAAAPALLTVAVLLHRAWRDHARCRRRYGAAWERYCKRVPSAIIPKVL